MVKPRRGCKRFHGCKFKWQCGLADKTQEQTAESRKQNHKSASACVERCAIVYLPDGTVMEKHVHKNGSMFVSSITKDGWVTRYRADGVKESETFYGGGACGKPWFTWHYVGQIGNERGVMKVYHEGDGVHPNGTVEYYRGERGSESLYCKNIL